MPTRKCLTSTGLLQTVEELRKRHVHDQVGHEGAAENGDDIGKEGQQRQSDQQRHDPRQHQHLHRIEAERANGVYLFVDLHGADLRRERAAGAAGNDDGGDQHTHLAQHGDADEIDGQQLLAEFAELIVALVGDDNADEEQQQADDGHGVQTMLFDVADQRCEANSAGVPQHATKRE